MITLTNDFHNTSTTIRDRAGRISPSQVKRAARKLCASGCKCSGVAGTRGAQYWGKGDERRRVWLAETKDGGAEITE